ncbi:MULTISPECIES: PA0069 family radical SAM protein [Inquilinus]|uniref:DNA repair photolyase n=1 Tax=Inquilinus ginsengisoli TaxID=363840 RepID=A0ABU1JV83_9PROT|nr:PA0069 family radical SAM protein [Inquilinus ginsengisoli]MDR6291465.1 DNA repair photolyase [Inquilinus ginsengisoli]
MTDSRKRAGGAAGNDRVLARGRSSRSNASGRFEPVQAEKFDDGWGEHEVEESRAETTLTADRAKTILSRNDSPDIGFDRSVNPFRGCEHGCIYCFARPTHAYLGLSPGLDFETKLFFKPDAAALLREELSKPSYVAERVQLGANTDCYQPIEKRLQITREVIKVLAEFQHPLGITTKNHLVTRDIDLLAPMAEKKLAIVVISITTLDRALARAMEPRASTPGRRLEAIRALNRAGIPTIVNVSPIIPGLTDHEIEAILDQAAEAGARYAHYSILRLSHELRDLFKQWLAAERPERASHVMSLIRQTRGGKENDTRFGLRMVGEGPVAEMLIARFRLARRRLGLDQKLTPLRADLFQVPSQPGDQLTLL